MQPHTRPDWLQPALHPVYLRLLCALLAQRGIDPEPILADAGLARSAVDNDHGLIAYAPVQSLLASALQRSGCPWLGLAFGAAAQLHTHGAVGSAAIASGTLGAALQVFARYARLRTRALRFALETHESGTRLHIIPAFDLGAGADFMADAVLVIVERMLESLSGQRLRGALYQVHRPRPPWAARYREFLSGTLQFASSDCATLHFERSLLDLKCLTADAQAHASATRECERDLDRDAVGAPLLQRVQALLGACGADFPTAAALAERLHMSPRNLFRRLAAEGTGYRELVDAERNQRARWLLANTGLAIDRIAERLGYADPTNFSRTFRRWNGVAPRAYRSQSASLTPGDRGTLNGEHATGLPAQQCASDAS